MLCGFWEILLTHTAVSIELIQTAREYKADRQSSCSQTQGCQRKAGGRCQGWVNILRKWRRYSALSETIRWFRHLSHHSNCDTVSDNGTCVSPTYLWDRAVFVIKCVPELTCSDVWLACLCVSSWCLTSSRWWGSCWLLIQKKKLKTA